MSGTYPTVEAARDAMFLDMNNPTFREDYSVFNDENWMTVEPATQPPPYTPLGIISIEPQEKHVLWKIIDRDEINAAILMGSPFLNYSGWSSTSAIGMTLFEILEERFRRTAPLPAVTSNAHIAGGIIPGNGGSNVHGPLASVIGPSNLALSGTSLFFADALDNRIRVVDISTGKVKNITLPMDGRDQDLTTIKQQFPSAEIRKYLREGGQRHKIPDIVQFNTLSTFPDGSPIYEYTGSGTADVIKPYKKERGMENVPAIRTGISSLKALAASPNGIVYFSDFIDHYHQSINAAYVDGSNTRYGVTDTTGFEVGRPVRIFGFTAPPGDIYHSIDYGFNGSGVIQSFVTNTSVTVNIASSGNPIGDAAFLILESRLRQIPRRSL